MPLQLALFLIDSQLALALLSTAPAFFQSKSFWDLSDSLSSCVALKLPVGPRSCWTSQKWTGRLALRNWSNLPVTHVPCPLAPTIAKIRHTHYSLWKRNLSHKFLPCQIPEDLALPRLIHCKLSQLCLHSHSLLLSSYLMQDKTEEEFSQCLQTSSAGSNSHPPGLSCIWASLVHHLWHYFFHFWPLVQILGHGSTVGSLWSSSMHPSLGRSLVVAPPPPKGPFVVSWSRYLDK